MKTKYYHIQVKVDGKWQDLSDIEYTEAEANESLASFKNTPHTFRKKFIKQQETIILTIKH